MTDELHRHLDIVGGINKHLRGLSLDELALVKEYVLELKLGMARHIVQRCNDFLDEEPTAEWKVAS